MERRVWWYVPAGQSAAYEAAAAVYQQLTGNVPTDLKAGQSLCVHSDLIPWHIELIDEKMLELWQEQSRLSAKRAASKERGRGKKAVQDDTTAQDVTLQSAAGIESSAVVPLVLFADTGASLALPQMGKMKPLHLDFELLSYRQRLLRGGRSKEPVARAIMQGLKPQGERLIVFDATSGLGRESMILAHAGAHVYAFERQIPIWIILSDALNRAGGSRFFPFPLPQLQKPGTIKDYQQQLLQAAAGAGAGAGADAPRSLSVPQPEVIYYDPMFPERESSASVKKEMVLFKQLIGADSDSLEFLATALELATERVVVKRPHDAPPLELPERGIVRSHFIDGGICRFDCYVGCGKRVQGA